MTTIGNNPSPFLNPSDKPERKVENKPADQITQSQPDNVQNPVEDNAKEIQKLLGKKPTIMDLEGVFGDAEPGLKFPEGVDPKGTTFAAGEEGGDMGGPSLKLPSDKPGIQGTTKAMGEEGGDKPTFPTKPDFGMQTTLAMGEEGGDKPTFPTKPDFGMQTTLATGEEGGDKPGIRGTTKAIGEEGGSPIKFPDSK